MVFESVVVEVLNRVLGNFVNNLDASQLNIGIWGGDVKLTNLEVKETALDDFDLPVKLKFGCLTKLILKIPWNNLYRQPVIAIIEGLNLIVVPNKGIVYSEEKAKKHEKEGKDKALMRLEENRKRRRKPPDLTSDTFAEKFVATVIKNLQVTVRNIHFRYEDKYSHRSHPFVVGATLEGIDFKTTDENWNEIIHKEIVKVVYKLVSLRNFTIYWNSDSKLVSDLSDNVAISQKMNDAIVVGNSKPSGYKYMLEPMNMQIKLALNQRPEADNSNWKIPKIKLILDLDTLVIAVGKFQYQDLLLLLEAQERFRTAAQYLKYRPHLDDYKDHYREWWHFAYNAIIEEIVRRRRNNWNWNRMKKHRESVRAYKDVWLKKQTEKNLSSKDQKIITETEEHLDVFNLNVARQQADMEIDRRGLKRLEDQPQGWISWAKNWWSGGSSRGNVALSSDIMTKFEEALTKEEKTKLFDAIDYQENTPPTDYPKHFVENVIIANLSVLMIVVEDALTLKFSIISAKIEHRASAQAINFKSGVKKVAIDGCGQQVLFVQDDSIDWLTVLVETNPLNRDKVGYDQCIKVALAPTVMKYYASAINTAIEALRPPESVRLNQQKISCIIFQKISAVTFEQKGFRLTAAAMARYEDVKARSLTGLAHVVDTRTKLVLDIRIAPLTIIISENGIFNEEKRNLIADLGLLTITTMKDDSFVEALSLNNKEAERRAMLLSRAYDKFFVKLTDVQLIFSDNYQSGMDAKLKSKSNFHLLQPTGLNVAFHKSSIDDLQLPKIKVMGELPDIIITISDERLLELVKLILSIPTPVPEKEINALGATFPPAGKARIRDLVTMHAIMEASEISENEEHLIVREKDLEKQEGKKTDVQQIQLEVNFTLKQVEIIVGTPDAVFLSIQIKRLGCDLQMRTFDMVAVAYLGDLTIEQPQYKSLVPERNTLFVIDNIHNTDQNLLQFKYVQADKESPFFATEYNSMEQAIDVSFKAMVVSVHQDALINLKKYFETLQAKIAEFQNHGKPAQDQDDAGISVGDITTIHEKKMLISRSSSQQSIMRFSTAESLNLNHAKRERELAQTRNDFIIKMHVNAAFDALSIYVGSTKCLDTALSISVVKVVVTMRMRTMEMEGGIKTIAVEDRTGTTIYKHLLALCGEDKEMLSFTFKQYNRTEVEKKHMQPSDLDFFIKGRFARIRFILLFLWLERMKHFAAPFQAEAAQIAAQAQSYASEKASQAAQKIKHLMKESALRIGLDIELAAPTILVPKNSMSLSALLVDFGKLTVVNSVSAAQYERKAIIDSMQINLTDVCFGISLLLEESIDVLSTCQILKPVTFSLLVYRNLSFEWYKAAPQMLIDAHLPLIEIGLTEEDYATILKTVNGNLTEGNELSSEPSPCVNSSTRWEASVDEKRQEYSEKAISEIDERPLSNSKAKSLVFSFKLDEIAALLYRGSSNLENSKGEIARKTAAGFAALRLKKIKLSGSRAENGELDIAVSLKIFIMDDERSEKTKMRRLLDKKPDSTGKIQEEFIAARYQTTATGDKIITFASSPFFLCLCPEFLGALVNFFTVRKTSEELAREAGKVNVSNTIQNKEKVGTIPSAGAVIMNCTMHEAEIILIEDAVNLENSQALILSFNVYLKANPDCEKQVVVGGIRNLQIISTYYLESRRDQAPYQVLKRTDINVQLTTEQKTMTENFIVHIGQLYLKISPAVIRLLSVVSSNFLSAANVRENSFTAQKQALKKYPNYWEKRKINRNEHWWFNVLGEKQEDFECAVDVAATMSHDQQATITMELLIVTLEAGVGNRTVPVVLLESSTMISASQWSTLLAIDADVQFQISYYNETFCVWEPIVEPVEVRDNTWKSWVLKIELRTHNEDELSVNGALPLPQKTINVKASELLNITVTKSLILLSYYLMDSFERAAKLISPPMVRTFPGNSKYLILNNAGISTKIGNTETVIINVDGQLADATPCTFVDLNVPFDSNEKIGLTQSQITKKAELRLIFDEIDVERYVNIMRSESRTFELPMKNDNGKQWKLVAETKVENIRRLIYLHSIVQFVNHLDIPFEIHSMRNGRLDFCGIAETDSEPLDIALPLLYTATGELFIRPSRDDAYEMSNESICWNKFEDKARYIVRCDLSEDMKQGLFIALIVEEVPLKAERSRSIDDSSYIVHIFSPLTLHNFLPFPLRLIFPIQKELSGGEEVPLNVIPGQNLNFEVDYRGDTYVAEMLFPVEHQDLMVTTLTSDEKILNLGVHWTVAHRKLDAEVYAPYWFVNNTGRTVRFAESNGGIIEKTAKCVPCQRSGMEGQYCDTTTQEPFSEPVLLPLDAKDFLSKKKARLSLFGNSWTNEFPLDAVGNAGRIGCKDENDSEQSVSLQISMCQSGLTKIITFLPFYLLHNQSRFPLEIREFGAQNWILVTSQACIGFWPLQKENPKYAVVRYGNTVEESILFPITESFEGFCQIDNDYLGVYVTVTVCESSSIIKLESFEPGMAPAIIMNATKKSVEFSQKGARSKKTLGPWESCAFTWTDVIRDRALEWKSGDATHSDDLIRNAFEDYKTSKSDSSRYYWISFLDGRQRIYLFTDDVAVMTTAYQAYEIELPVLSVEISLQGIGISIVDNFKTEEIAYMCIASSTIIWEQFVKSRFKPFTVKQMEIIEHAYQAWLPDHSEETVMVDKLEFDFTHMKLRKQKDWTDIRRQFQIGLWMQYRQTPHQSHFHMKLNHLQIDNQLPACVFPCLLSVVPPPKSVIQDNTPKPFCELSYIRRESEHSRIAQIKYLHLLVQEFSVQVDQGFVNAMLELISSQADSKPYTKETFVKDFEMTKNQLEMIAGMTMASQQAAYYESLHISPLMIHLSFSQGGSSGGKRVKDKALESKEAIQVPPIQSEFVNVFLKSIGVTVTEIQDVIFKLAFFEREYAFYTISQLQSEITGHYTSQIIKQLYVLVLGLDILGNPFGLVRGLSSGVQDFFYQPFQGAVQGPEEFAEGVALGVKGLVGATVGGGVGAVSRIAGTLGKGVAALTLDEEYQRKRQQMMNRRPKTIGEGVARGAKGVGQGFYEGVTGVVSKPLAGARSGGAGGFAKGLSLGLVGIITRPLSGAVDFASSTLDAVKSATVGIDEMKPLRPSRVIFSDNIVRPYSQKIAAGAQIFREADNGSVADTDYFLAHAPISEKSIFIITDRRVMNVRKSDVVGSWNIEWQILYTEMNRPTLSGKTILINLRKKQKSFLKLSMLGGRVVELIEQASAAEIYNKLLVAYEIEARDV